MFLEGREKLGEHIIRLLGEHPKSSVEDMRASLRAKGIIVTIQAIYKELRILRKSGIIVKTGKHYRLAFAWILHLADFAERLRTTYLRDAENTSLLPPAGKKNVWRFQSLLQLNEFWSHILLLLVERSSQKKLLGWNPHPWFHLVQTKQEERYITSLKLTRGTLYLILGGKTFLDRWAEHFFDKSVVRYSFGKSTFHPLRSLYINVIDEYVLTVKLDKNTTVAIDEFYEEVNKHEDLDSAVIMDIFHSNARATLQLEHSPLKARKLRKKFSNFFGERF